MPSERTVACVKTLNFSSLIVVSIASGWELQVVLLYRHNISFMSLVQVQGWFTEAQCFVEQVAKFVTIMFFVVAIGYLVVCVLKIC